MDKILMKHDLKAINAAIQLGDRCVPPVGCKIRYNVGLFGRESIGVVDACDQTGVFHVRVDVYVRVEFSGYELIELGYNDINGRMLEILHIPESTPPFEEWLRY
jgi:hypothetical protein